MKILAVASDDHRLNKIRRGSATFSDAILQVIKMTFKVVIIREKSKMTQKLKRLKT